MPKTKSLLEATRKLVKQDKRPYYQIAQGAGVPESWLRDMMKKERSPSVRRVQVLYEALTGKPLLDA